MTAPLVIAAGGEGGEAIYSRGSALWMQQRLTEAGIVWEALICVTLDEFAGCVRDDRRYLLLFHGGWGEGGGAQAILEHRGLPFSGSRATAAELCLDKARAKAVVAAAGIAVPRAIDDSAVKLIEEKFVVKPRFGGSSIGVHLTDALPDPRTGAAEEMLVEEFIEGHIVTVAIFGSESGATALEPVCIEPFTDTVYGEDVKLFSARNYVAAEERMHWDAIDHLKATATQAFAALGCAGLARADFIVRPSGQPVFLEMNAIPGVGDCSNALACYAATGLGAQDLVKDLLRSIR